VAVQGAWPARRLRDEILEELEPGECPGHSLWLIDSDRRHSGTVSSDASVSPGSPSPPESPGRRARSESHLKAEGAHDPLGPLRQVLRRRGSATGSERCRVRVVAPAAPRTARPSTASLEVPLVPAPTPVSLAMKALTLSSARRSGSCGRYPTVAVCGLSAIEPCSSAARSRPASRRSRVELARSVHADHPGDLPPARITRSGRRRRGWLPCRAARPLAISVAAHRYARLYRTAPFYRTAPSSGDLVCAARRRRSPPR